RGIIRHAIGSVGQHIIESVSCVPGKKVSDPIPSCDHRSMPHIVTGRRHHENPSILGNGMRRGKRSNRRAIKLDQLGAEPDRPPLRQTPHHFSLPSLGLVPAFVWGNDAGMWEMMKPTGMIVVIVCENNG